MMYNYTNTYLTEQKKIRCPGREPMPQAAESCAGGAINRIKCKKETK